MHSISSIPQKIINCRGQLIDLAQPRVMGIINLSPDSFYAPSRAGGMSDVLHQAEKMLSEGATFLDIGGYSTRPGADDIAPEEELKRVIPAIEAIVREFPSALLSIDTFRGEVARAAVDSGAALVNDISGGSFDEEMIPTVAALKVPYIIMHIQGTPQTMQINPQYKNVVREVMQYFSFLIERLQEQGISDIILDPGFGFGKTVHHNYELLKHLGQFGQVLGFPVMAGLSRKSLVNKVLDIKAAESLNGTTSVNTIALMNGASILRVHDVKEAMECIRIVRYYAEVS